MISSFFKFSKLFFLKYKISAPFSLVEAKTHTFNIHIGKLLKNINYTLKFLTFFFLNNLHARRWFIEADVKDFKSGALKTITNITRIAFKLSISQL